MGIVQGITEWLPISSSGHLVIFQTLFGFEQPVVYDLMLHIGSLIVVFIVFWKDIKELVVGVIKGNKEKFFLLSYLVIATIPIALVGYFLNDFVKSAFNSLLIVGFGLIFSSVLLFLSRYPRKKDKQMGIGNSIIVGLFQAIAILPGVSRSGSTISSGMILGVKKEEAVRFGFFLFIPAILGATILEIGELNNISNLGYMIIGTIFTIIFGFLSLKLLLNIIKKDNFYWFSLYCLILGLVVLLAVLI